MILETIWDGAHGNQDRDLLLQAGIPLKRFGRPDEPGDFDVTAPRIRLRATRAHGDAIRDAIKVCLLQAGSLTIPQLAVTTGYPEHEIRSGMQYFQRRGQVEAEALERTARTDRNGQSAWKAYRWGRA